MGLGSKRLRAAIVMVLAAIAFVCSAERSSASSTGQIVGRVTDASTHAGVAAASVTAMSTTGTYRALTDRDGFFSIVNAFPNTYVLSVTATDYGTIRTLAGSVNPEQAIAVNVQIDKTRFDLKSSASNALSIVQPRVVPDRFVLTSAAADATNGSGGSYGLYQVPGIVGTLPGVTLDSGVNVHIRGSRLDEVGYEYDGLNAVDPITGLTATNLVDDGIVRLQVNESGAYSSAAYGIGAVNSVVNEGSYPGHGSITTLIQTPTFYHGMNLEYGNATPDHRFSWFVSGVLWNSGYDWGNRGTFVAGAESMETALGDGPVGDVAPSRDQVINLNYRPGGGLDDIQFLASNGFERFDNALRPLYWPSTNPLYGRSTTADPINGLCNNNNFALFPGQPNCTAAVGDATDHVDQGYSIDKLQLTHDFHSGESLSMWYGGVHSIVETSMPFGDAPFADSWQKRQSDQQEAGTELSAQLNAENFLKAGMAEDFSKNYLLSILVTSGYAVMTPANSRDRSFWMSDELRPNEKLAVDLAVRSASRTYYRVAAAPFTDSGTEGDAGFSFSPDAKTVLRASYGEHPELPFVARVERILTHAPNFTDISASNQLQVVESQPVAAQAHSFDISVERSVSEGAALKITPFWRTSSDLIVPYGSALSAAQAAEPYYVNGIDVELQLLHAGNGLSGYLDYTHTRALAGAVGDFSQPLGLGAAAAHGLFPVSFIAPDVANAVLTWRRQKWAINPVITYSSGYPYGVGRFTYNNLNCPNSTASSTGDPTQPCGAVVRNPAAYSDSNGGNCNPGACLALIDSAESRFADGRICCAAVTANLNVSYSLAQRTIVGLQWENLNRSDAALALTQNPYFPNSPYGSPGFNGYVDYGATPYIPAGINNSEEFLFLVTEKI